MSGAKQRRRRLRLSSVAPIQHTCEIDRRRLAGGVTGRGSMDAAAPGGPRHPCRQPDVCAGAGSVEGVRAGKSAAKSQRSGQKLKDGLLAIAEKHPRSATYAGWGRCVIAIFKQLDGDHRPKPAYVADLRVFRRSPAIRLSASGPRTLALQQIFLLEHLQHFQRRATQAIGLRHRYPVHPVRRRPITSARPGDARQREAACDRFHAKVVRSGATPICSIANNFVPVRPAPLCTSSAISMIPCSSHSARKRSIKAGVAA